MVETEVTFHVKLEENPGYRLFIVGDCMELGQWKPSLAKPLHLMSQSDDLELWSGSFGIRASVIKYRLFLGWRELVTRDLITEEAVLVHVWETMPSPRCLTVTGTNNVEVTFGHLNGIMSLDRGWLTGQFAVHLTLRNDPFHFFCPLNGVDRYFLKCLPVDMRCLKNSLRPLEKNKDSSFLGSDLMTNVFVSILDDNQAAPQLLPRDGILFKPNDFLTFRIETWHAKYLAFKIVVSVEDSDKSLSHAKVLREIGSFYIEPMNLDLNKDSVSASILSKDHEILGRVKVDILVITSLTYECNMSSCIDVFQKLDSNCPWFIGHRGMGRTLYDDVQGTALAENTILSLKRAVGHGADFVEFDVMLSKDRIPILHHDFVTSISARGKFGAEEKKITIPVQNLNWKDLQSLQTLASGVSIQCRSNGLVEDDEQPFPLLRSCLEKVDLRAGFNIEIKYCMKLRTGELEEGLVHFPARNGYVDDILSVVLHHSGDRRIILSSFDPDVCSMLRAKQNRYPVLFLTQGETERYPQYADSRTWNVESAFLFAMAECLHGVCVHSEGLLKDPSLINRGKKRGLWVICWGDDNNSRENIKVLVESGVDGIILDRIDEFLDR